MSAISDELWSDPPQDTVISERLMCNIRGKLGKRMLGVEKVGYIKLNAFRMFPLES